MLPRSFSHRQESTPAVGGDEGVPDVAVGRGDSAAFAGSRITFEELARSYNFENTPSESEVFTRLVIDECARRDDPTSVLDVGCGSGIARSTEPQWRIKQAVGDFWGVEPNPDARSPEGLFDRHIDAFLEDADLPSGAFHLAYSYMVMEHVERPEAFLRAIRDCLRPGGSYLFLTPNRRHYFTRIASSLRAVGLDEWILRMVRRSMVDQYHHPVFYRCNSEGTIGAVAEDLGFSSVEFAYLEPVGPLPYFPRPLRFIFHLLAAKRRWVRNPRSLLALVCRLTK